MALDDATPAAYKVEFAVPGAPVPKGRPRFVATVGTDGKASGRAYTPSLTRTYEESVRAAARAAMGRLNATSDAVMLSMVAFIPIPASWSRPKKARAMAGLLLPVGRPDLDNYEKAITDALNGICYEDDSQICDVVKSKRYSDRPRVHIAVHPVNGFNADPFYVPKHQRPKKRKAK